ncbi:MAG: hypothetical protein ACT4QC_01770 [Planctomycetaceae bacterium]
MNRLAACGFSLALYVVCGTAGAQESTIPRGYQFFSHRVRPAATARARATETSSAVSTQNRAHRPVSYSPAEGAAKPPDRALEPQPAARNAPPQARASTAYTGFGYYFPGYTWVGSNYSYFNYGTPVDWPQCGERYDYEWCGRRYTAPGYSRCDYGGCGPRYDCGYRPCWNDCGPTVFECRRRRGSYLDCLWQMGGWDCYHSPSCCTYPCGPTYCWPGGVPSVAATPSQKVSTDFYNYLQRTYDYGPMTAAEIAIPSRPLEIPEPMPQIGIPTLPPDDQPPTEPRPMPDR